MKLINNIIDTAKNRQDQLYNYIKDIFLQDYEFPISGVFGNILSAVASMTNNLLLYIEDIFNEHNTESATRKSSVVSLAKLGGYEVNTGTAARVRCKFILLNNNNNKLKIKRNGRFNLDGYTYNLVEENDIVIPNNQLFTLVEGTMKKQQSISDGSKLYTVNIKDVNIDTTFLKVYVNNILYNRKLSLYDMKPDEYAYTISTSIDKGIDITFGDGLHGHQLKENSTIIIEYLTHSGVVTINKANMLKYIDELTYSDNSKVDTLTTVQMQIVDYMNGTNCDTYNKVKKNIGTNTRNNTLCTKDSIKNYINNFSNIVCVDVLDYNNIIMPIVINRLNTNRKTLSNDLFLSPTRRSMLLDAITNNYQFIRGTSIVVPELNKYRFSVNVNYTSENDYDNKIRTLIRAYFNTFPDGNPRNIFVEDLKNYLIKNLNDIKNIIISFDSEVENQAKQNMKYTINDVEYDEVTNTYKTICREYLYHGQPINIDEFGNIKINDLFGIAVLDNIHYDQYKLQPINITHTK